MAKAQHRVEALPVVLIVICGIVVLPTLIFATGWQIIGGPAMTQLSIISGLTTAVCVFVGSSFIRLAWRELKGAVGITIDDQGIHRSGPLGRLEIAWGDISRLEKLEFGVVQVETRDGQQLRLCTYMFERRASLERLLTQRSGQKL